MSIILGWTYKYLPGSGACVVTTVGCVVSVNMIILNAVRASLQGKMFH